MLARLVVEIRKTEVIDKLFSFLQMTLVRIDLYAGSCTIIFVAHSLGGLVLTEVGCTPDRCAGALLNEYLGDNRCRPSE